MSYSSPEPKTKSLYDFVTHTHQKIELPASIPIASHYITDEWLLIEVYKSRSSVSREGYALLNLQTGAQTDLNEVSVDVSLRDQFPRTIHDILPQHQTVYVKNSYILVAPILLGDSSSPNHIIFTGRGIGPYPQDSEQIAENLRAMGIAAVNLNTPASVDGDFYYSPSPAAIYESSTNEIIVASPSDKFASSGWAYRDQGIILYSAITECLIGGISMNVSMPCLFHVPHPILLLRQDPQYLPPDLQAHFAAQDALEARNQQVATTIMATLIVATIGTVAYTLRARHSLARAERPV